MIGYGTIDEMAHEAQVIISVQSGLFIHRTHIKYICDFHFPVPQSPLLYLLTELTFLGSARAVIDHGTEKCTFGYNTVRGIPVKETDVILCLHSLAC